MPDEHNGGREQTGPGRSAKSGELPEALATFAATAKSDAKVSPNGGLKVTPDTAALPGDLGAEHDAATKVLREGVLHEDQGADEAIDKLPDRTRST